MKISELKKGQKITIRCKQKTLLVDMDAFVADIYGEVVLLQLVRHEGQVVNFSSPTIQIIIIYEDGLDMPKAWINCKIQRRTVGGKEYHALAALKSSVKINRRKVTRVLLNMPGKVRVTNNPNGLDVTVHDLCVNGVGIISPVKIEEQELKHLQIQFADEVRDEDETIRIEARLVWRKELEGGKVFYGCRLTNAEENLAYYITEKIQQERNKKQFE